jgi:hypothetical protein
MPAQGGEVCNNFFGMNMTTSSRALKFVAPGSSGYHTGLTISGNWFRNNTGQSASIDVTYLATSACRQNYDASTGAHYTGVHNDGYGNALFPPVTGSACSFSQAAYLWGDTTYPHSFIAGLTSGAGVLVNAGTTGLGYAAGAGGAVTQLTSRATGVTLNKLTGAITLVSAAGSTTPFTFTVTNSTVAATDTVVMNCKSATDLWEIFVTAVSAGSFKVTAFTTGGTTVEQPVFNFTVIKGAAS